MNNLAVIPARGGSKRIPKKNIRDFCGQPIIKYSINAALDTDLFEEIMVSTDDEEIKNVAVSSGASIPFSRSEQNASDYATLSDVLLEVLQNYTLSGKTFDFVCIILPTAPLISSQKIQEGFQLITSGGYSSVIPVVRFAYPIQRALKVLENGCLEMIQPENKNIRSQDLQPAYHDSGQFYWIRTKDFLQEKSIFMNATGAIELSEFDAQDIDTEEDWQVAELKFLLHRKAHETGR